MNRIWRTLPNHLPRLCLLCQMDAPCAFCVDCQGVLPFIDHACRYCALPLERNTQLERNAQPDAARRVCSECQDQPPPFCRAIIPLAFNYPVNHLISRFKDLQDLAIGEALTQFALDYCQAARPPLLIDAVCAVPSLSMRRFTRGFNPAEFIARRMAVHLNKPLSPIIHKIRKTEDQRGLTRSERYRNLQRAFKIEPRLLTSIRHVLLVDDVVTTGATARHLSELLLLNGVETVTLVALARTPKVYS